MAYLYLLDSAGTGLDPQQLLRGPRQLRLRAGSSYTGFRHRADLQNRRASHLRVRDRMPGRLPVLEPSIIYPSLVDDADQLLDDPVRGADHVLHRALALLAPADDGLGERPPGHLPVPQLRHPALV